jgi:hypothetical protein
MEEWKVKGKALPRSRKFKYLGVELHDTTGTKGSVEHRLSCMIAAHSAVSRRLNAMQCPAPDTAALFVEHVVRLYGVPLSIVSDRDSKLTGAFWRCLFAMLGTRLAMSSSYHPQTDRQSERSNRWVQQVLRCYCGSYGDDWDAHLSV